ncbi:MAG TPA: hypothetical protein VIP81_24225, partial [Chitinophaga sp.]
MISLISFGQQVYQIRADSVRIYNVCDTAELILENRTQGVSGFLFNKGRGRTEFRKVRLEKIGNSQIAISGQDTLDLSTLPGLAGVDTIYRSGDNIVYKKNGQQYSISAPAGTSNSFIQNQITFAQPGTGFWTSGPGIAAVFAAYSPPSTTRDFQMATGTSATGANLRWSFSRANTEATGNVGNDFFISRHDNTGVPIGTPLSINRSTGVTTFSAIPMAGGNPLWTDANHPAGLPFTATLTGANVLASLTSNSAGHITTVTTRALIPSDISAAPATGSTNYIQNQTTSAQGGAGFWTSGVAVASKYTAYSNPGIGRDYDLSTGTSAAGANLRWSFNRANTEATGNVGNDFYITRYDNTGAPIGTPLSINRATGVTTFSAIPNAAGNPVWTDANHPAGGPNSQGTGLTGAFVYSNVVTNSAGHLTAVATRALTAADIGASATAHTHSLTLTGDVTGTGTVPGSITLNITPATVTYADIQNVTTGRILGRYTASTGSVQELTVGTGLALNATTGILTATGVATESDPIANTKTVTLTAGTGISITGAAQTITNNPTFTITNTGAPATGSANYIQNGITSAQVANSWI